MCFVGVGAMLLAGLRFAQSQPYTTGNSVLSSPAIANGVVYVGSTDGNVYAFG
jgi:outer membrane protein assembly factor BamB